MDPQIVQRRLVRAERRVQTLEKLIEDRTRELFEAQHLLLQANEHLTRIIESMVTAVVVVDTAGNIQKANQAAHTMLGYDADELVGTEFSQICPEAPAGISGDPAPGNSVGRVELTYRAKDGSLLPVLLSHSPLHAEANAVTGMVCIALDMTDRKRLEAQLVHAGKLAAIGQLAAGVAHEVNNPIGYVYSNLGTLGEFVEDLTRCTAAYKGLEAAVGGDPEALETARASAANTAAEVDLDFLLQDALKLITESREGAERITRIVRNLRDFARSDSDQSAMADLSECLESTLNIVANELKYKADIKRDYADLAPVRCFPMELNQVFMNLLVNASQAIETHGTITLRTYSEPDWACVEISDTGGGIAADLLPHVFEPFFTTKGVGEGTGLGLSIAYRVVTEQHKGELLVHSTEGEGTTFTVRIPRESSEERPEQAHG
jgi:PAS domain S-box-containing protein